MAKKNRVANQKKKKKSIPRPGRQIDVCAKIEVPPCVRQYALALADPWARGALGACIPDGNGGPTYKFTTRRRKAIAQTPSATNDVLFISYTPRCASDSNGLAISSTPIATPTFNAGTVFESVPPISVPFGSGDFGIGKLESRLVSASIRVTCLEAPLNAHGAMFGFSHMSGPPAATNDVRTEGDFFNTRYVPYTNGKTLQLNYSHDQFTEYAKFQPDADALSFAAVTSGPTSTPGLMNIVIPNQGGFHSHTYLVETIAHWELRGRTVISRSTMEPGGGAGHSTAAYGGYADTIRAAASGLPSPTVLLRGIGDSLSAAGYVLARGNQLRNLYSALSNQGANARDRMARLEL